MYTPRVIWKKIIVPSLSYNDGDGDGSVSDQSGTGARGIFGKRYGKVGCKRRRFNKYLRVHFCTQCACDMLYLNIYLERSTNGTSWSPYDSWSYTKANGSTLSKSFNITSSNRLLLPFVRIPRGKRGSTKEYFHRQQMENTLAKLKIA